MEPERELSVVLKLQPRVWTTISGSVEQSAGEEVDTRSKSRTASLLFPTRWEGQYNTVLRVWGELSVPCALLYTSSSIMYVNNLHRLLSATYCLRHSPVIIISPSMACVNTVNPSNIYSIALQAANAMPFKALC